MISGSRVGIRSTNPAISILSMYSCSVDLCRVVDVMNCVVLGGPVVIRTRTSGFISLICDIFSMVCEITLVGVVIVCGENMWSLRGFLRFARMEIARLSRKLGGLLRMSSAVSAVCVPLWVVSALCFSKDRRMMRLRRRLVSADVRE